MEEELPVILRSSVTDCVSKLQAIWNQMGLGTQGLRDRHATVKEVMKKMMNDLIIEEQGHLEKTMQSIENHGRERNKLAKELGVNPIDPDEDLGLIQLEHFLRLQLSELKEQKEQRMKEVLRLKSEDEDVCRTLGLDTYYISSSIIPTTKQMDELRQHIKDMENLKAKRLAKFLETKSAIVELMERLDVEPVDAFEREVICEAESTFILSASNLDSVELILTKLEDRKKANIAKAEDLRRTIFGLMNKLKMPEKEIRYIEFNLAGHSPADLNDLTTKLDELEVLKSEKMEEFIKATREELVEYWEKCYYCQDQRDKFRPYFSTDYSEELLEKHEKEVEELRTYYENNASLFAKVAKRQNLWKLRLELEAKQKDPSRLMKAKGKDLINEEKDRKRVIKQLPIIEAELEEDMADYYRVNGVHFLVGGVPYEDFIHYENDQHEREMEEEREVKKINKKKNLMHETRFGSKPVTPAANRTLAMKRKAGGMESASSSANLTASKRLRPGESLARSTASSTMKSPYPKRTPNRMAANKSKYGASRPGAGASRRILGDRNDSVIAGYGNQPRPLNTDAMSSISSDKFHKDIPLSSTFQMLPGESPVMKKPVNSTPRRGGVPATPTFKGVNATPTFKTPSSRIATPANKSGKKMTTLRSGRALPFLI